MQLLFQSIRFVSIVIGIVFFFYTFKYIFYLSYPFVLAILLAYFINPLVTYLENKLTFSRGVTTFIVISLLSTIIISLLIFIFIEFIQGTTYLAEKLPAHFQVFMRFIESFLHSKIIPMYENALSFIQSLNQSQDRKSTRLNSSHVAISYSVFC